MLAAAIVLIPGIDLMAVMLTAQFINGLILPVLLVFLGVGVLVGVFGGLTAIRNYLKV